jgi:hypothetical protein
MFSVIIILLSSYKVFKNGFLFIMAQYKVARKVIVPCWKHAQDAEFSVCVWELGFILSVLQCTYMKSLFCSEFTTSVPSVTNMSSTGSELYVHYMAAY